jgi:type VI secretion system protein ImpL
MFSFLKSRKLLILIGFVLIAVFVWYAGPYFAFGDYHPLESATARLIFIALVIGFWFGWLLLKQLRASLVSQKLVAAVVNQAKGEPPSAEAVKLRERFEEGVATLKQRGRRGRSLYELPWYVIIGAPGSGKTTALLNSGLKFPLEQRVGKGALRGVGGTRNCDWWFTDEAVFLDTAGRYTTQDSDPASDVEGWREFLALLRKYRKRRPLNGVILTISAHDLMTQGEAVREANADAARRRLRELNEQLHIQLPVYLMVTKCDLVAGFTEYFDDLTQDARAQVWGVTFPYEQTVSGQATRVFPAEFDALLTRLNSRLFARLEEDRDVRRRTAVFAFPQQVAALRGHLNQFVQEVLESTRANQQILLRGVYLTSGTQEGTPIDRLLGAIGRRFGVAPDAVAPPTGRGKAYFVERLLKDVMIGESGLAGVNRRVEVQKAAAQLGAYAALALLTIVGLIALSVSYGRNRTYIGEVEDEVAKLRETPTVRAGAATEAMLPRLDAVRNVVDSADRYRADTPLSMQWGLFQGTSVGKSARDAYLRELEGLVLPVFAGRVKQALVEHASEPDRLYEYLKAYLMLGDPAHFDREYLQSVADVEWNASSRSPAQGAALSKHFQGLLDYADPLRPIALDAALVAQARSTIRQASIPQIMYGELKRAYASDGDRAVRLDVTAGAGAEQVLKRKSGVSLSTPIPSLYSKPVFNEITTTRTPLLVKQFIQDSWVWGEGGLGSVNPVKLATDLTDVYERDYMAVWDGVLDDIQFVTFATAQQMANALAILSSPTSPLRGLLRGVVDNTTLIDLGENPPPQGSLAAAKNRIADSFGRAMRSVKEGVGVSTAKPGSLVTAHFQPIQRLMAGAPGSAPIDKVLSQLGQMQQQLKSLSPDVGGADPLEALSNPTFRSALQSLQQDAASLPPLVGALVAQISKGTEGSVVADASSDLHLRYQQEVLRTCVAVVANRYPFVSTSTMDITLADFSRVFGWNGIFDRFFNENMQNLVNTERSPWEWRNRAVKLSSGMLAQFEQARLIRDTFFPQGGQVPQQTFTVTITDVDRADRRFILQVDGQNFDNRHGVQRKWPAKWPATDPGFAAATFEDRAGAWAPTQKFDGMWAWLRLIESGQPQREPPLHTVISFRQGDYLSRVRIEASSDRNPFVHQEWRQFRCGS